MDIAEFLTARYDEEQADAANWSGPARIAWLTYRNDDGEMRYTTVAASHGDYDPWTADGRELAAPTSARIVWDPARVLRDVEAKRAILALHTEYGIVDNANKEIAVCYTCGDTSDCFLAHDWPCDTVKRLAAVYANHADYDPAWAVTQSA